MPVVQISEFTKTVLKNIQSIPSGRVATYKQIAQLSGKPQASRGVAWILNSCSTKYKLPWHRVLSSQGKISFEKGTHNFKKQLALLKKEGVELDSAGRLNLQKFQWNKKLKIKKSKGSKPSLFRSES